MCVSLCVFISVFVCVCKCVLMETVMINVEGLGDFAVCSSSKILGAVSCMQAETESARR